MNTATIEGAPDDTAPRAGIDSGSALGPSPPSNPARASLYALPPWGILVIRCEEKTVIADNSLRRRADMASQHRPRLPRSLSRDGISRVAVTRSDRPDARRLTAPGGELRSAMVVVSGGEGCGPSRSKCEAVFAQADAGRSGAIVVVEVPRGSAGAGQAGGGSACSAANASVSWPDQGQSRARRRIVRRAWRAIRPDWCKSR